MCIMSSQARTIPEDYDSDITYNNRRNLSKKISFKFKVDVRHREVQNLNIFWQWQRADLLFQIFAAR